MRPSFHGCLIAALLLQTGLPLQAASQLDASRKAAQTFYREGRYDQATTLYNRIAADNPQDVSVLKESMWALWNMQSFTDAVRLANQVQTLRPDDVEARNVLNWARAASNKDKVGALRQRALNAYKRGSYAESAAAYRELADLEPNNLSTLKDWMSALWAGKQYEETDRVARQILALRPNDPHAAALLQQLPTKITQRKLKDIMEQAGKNDKQAQLSMAIKLDEELVRLRPNDPDSYRSLALAYFRMQRFSEAKVIASLLTTLTPDDPSAWNLLGRIDLGLNAPNDAVASFEKSLALNPVQTSTLLNLGRLFLERREFARAQPYLEKAAAIPGSDQADAYPLLAKALYWQDRYADAAAVWLKATARFPAKLQYKYQYAMALYYAGQREKALAVLHSLYNDDGYDPAASFLADDMVAQGDPASAQRLLEKTLDFTTDFSEARAIRLARLYADHGPKKKLASLLQHMLSRWPDHLEALLLKANLLQQDRNYRGAKTIYEKVLAINPYHLDAIRELAEAEQALGHDSTALTLARRLRQWDPTSLDFALKEASVLYERGDYDSARRVLKDWLKDNEKDPDVLTILLYHGLTPLANDAILAYPYHHSTAALEDHLKALRDAGYTSITLSDVDAWLDRRMELPKKAVVIAFDDARSDSFKYGDPLLEKYGFKAVMFVPITNIEGEQPPIGYASWDLLETYRKTGRWFIEAHGDESHVRQPLGESGMKGPFLANRRWIESEKRMESIDEWKRRISRDYETNRQKIYDRMGITAIGYAFPEGVYGQQDQVNTPDAAPTNRKLVMEYFRMAFVQNAYGTNLRTADRALLKRLEPGNDWTGQQLLDHQRDTDPFNRVYIQLLDWAASEGRVQEAYTWWKRLKQNGASERLLSSREAIIRLTAGDYAEGYALAQRALLGDSLPETKQTIQKYLARQGWSILPGFRWHSEDPNRSDVNGSVTVELPRMSSGLRLFGTYAYEEFKEDDRPTIQGQVGGLGIAYPLGISHDLMLQALGHLFKAPGQKVLEGQAAWNGRWTDSLDSELSLSHRPGPTNAALNGHITYYQGRLRIHWFKDNDWTAEASERFRYYSDENARSTTEILLARRLMSFLNLRAVLHGSYDTTNSRSLYYYSPDNLIQAGLGPQISGMLGKRTAWAAHYWPAYAQEQGRSSEWNHNFELGMELHLGKTLSLKPSYRLYQAPSYKEHTLELECGIPF
jgi:tetratricopeptide (TPR) repeat protein